MLNSTDTQILSLPGSTFPLILSFQVSPVLQVVLVLPSVLMCLYYRAIQPHPSLLSYQAVLLAPVIQTSLALPEVLENPFLQAYRHNLADLTDQEDQESPEDRQGLVDQ